MTLLAAASFVWVFAVDVSEQWSQYDQQPRSLGGWTHNGPYTTKAECETARREMMDKPYAYRDESHTVWHRPRECRRETAESVEALRAYEMDLMRRGRVR